MDADTLVKRAQKAIREGEYEFAKECLKQAATLAPLRGDIREMLEFVLQQKPGAREKARPRGLFQTERERAPQPAPSPLRRRRPSWVSFAVTTILIVLVGAGGVTGFLVWKPQLVKFAARVGGEETPSTATATASPTTSTPPGAPVGPQTGDALAAADALAAQSQFEEAVRTLSDALRGASENRPALEKRLAQLRFTWGKELVARSQFDQALANLENAARVDDQNANVYYWLGQAHLLKGKRQPKSSLAAKDYREAERALRECIRLDPSMLEAYYTLARTYSAAGEPDQAATYYKEVIRRAPDSTEANRARDDLKMMDLR